MAVASVPTSGDQASVARLGSQSVHASAGFAVPAGTQVASMRQVAGASDETHAPLRHVALTHAGPPASQGVPSAMGTSAGQVADVPSQDSAVSHGPLAGRHVVPAGTRWQLASQHAVPFAGPASHSSPVWTIPSPQPGLATSVTSFARSGSGRRSAVSIVTRRRNARVSTFGTPVTSRYWQAREGS